jgi:hypothetical protein
MFINVAFVRHAAQLELSVDASTAPSAGMSPMCSAQSIDITDAMNSDVVAPFHLVVEVEPPCFARFYGVAPHTNGACVGYYESPEGEVIQGNSLGCFL